MRLPGWLKVSKRAEVYKRVFQTPEGEIVLADLRKFCRLERSTLVVSPVMRMVDPIATAHAEGRRECLLRIMSFLNIGYDDIMRMRYEEELEGPRDEIQ